MKQLKSFFSENMKYIEGMTNEEIIKNIKYLNNRLSLMPISSIFEPRDINERSKKIYDTACSLGFFIRMEDSKKFAPKKLKVWFFSIPRKILKNQKKIWVILSKFWILCL
jgi:hypothetical protein